LCRSNHLFWTSQQGDNGAAVRIFLVIVLIHARFKTGGEQQKTPCKTGPVMDITHQGKQKHTVHKADHPQEERERKEPGK